MNIESFHLFHGILYDIDENELLHHDSPECSKCSDLDRLTALLKEKLKMSSTQEKVKILILAPESWSISKTCNEFDVSKYLIKKARKLKNSKGILAEPGKKKGNVLSDETKLKVLEIFKSDEFSRMCPGKKDWVSIKINAENFKKQKRLLLVPLKDLYIEFKKRNPQLKIGFTKFCELHPKWCITAASKGSHTVCVCSYHQNVKLLCSAIPGNLDYKQYMNLCVCDLADRNCMFHLCENCPDITNLSNYLKNIFEDNDFDDDEKINYKHWVATDCTTLACIQSTVDEFIQTATEMINDLSPHHFIKDSQASYL